MDVSNEVLRKISILFTVLVVLSGGLFPLAAQSPTAPELVVSKQDDQFGTVRWVLPVRHAPLAEDAGPAVLRVYTQAPGQSLDLPAVMGRYSQNRDTLFFRPRFPFLAGRTYYIWYVGNETAQVIPVLIPQSQLVAPPTVTAIYPSADLWPANQLKFYIHFDQRMRAGYLTDYLQLFDDEGTEVIAPFLDMAQELWDPEQQRLTVWFDPGRIKSLLIPNREMGPPLRPRRTYRLVIRKGWPAAGGIPLAEDQIKVFRTGSKDSQKPDPATWDILCPAAGSKTPLRIHFPEAMDRALLQSGLAVFDDQGNLLEGEIRVGPEEKSWSWHPDQTWQSGTYRLRISTDVEDLAGNNLVRLFDAPAETETGNQAAPPYFERVFTVR